MARDDSSEESVQLDKISDNESERPAEDDDSDDMAEEGSETESAVNSELERMLARQKPKSYLEKLEHKYAVDDDEEDVAASVYAYQPSPTPTEADDFKGFDTERDTAAMGLYPTIADPKLFMLRVKGGFARTLCAQIMYKCLARSAHGEDMMIKSCFCRDHLSEYIYVEAHRQAHVLNVISGLQGAWRKIKLIPVSEMPSTLARTKAAHVVKAGSWGRFRYGLHKGDLCRILEVDDSKEVYEIEVVPRVDYGKLLDSAPVTANEAGFRVQKLRTRTRPMPRFFTDEQFYHTSLYRKHDGITTIAEYQAAHPKAKYMSVAGRKFTFDGKEIKIVRQAAVATDRKLVNMTTDEHMRFLQGKIPRSHKEIRRLQEIREVDLSVGDKVKVVSGELRNTTGVVIEIFEDASGTKYKVRATNNALLREAIPFTKEVLQKVIEEGTYVKILAGGHKGETGMVLRVRGNMVKVFSSRNSEEYEVFMSDVTETREISFGVPKFGEFEVFELVKLRGTGCGMIIKIENDQFTILNDLGREVHASHAELQEVLCSTKLSTTRKGRRQIALDKFGNEIQQGDAVRVVSDKSLWEGKVATISHVYGEAVWLEARDVRENMGFIVLSRHEIWQIGGERHSRDLGIDAYTKPVANKRSDVDHDALALETDAKKRRKKEREMTTMVGKRVRVSKGYYKGYLGVVTSIHGGQVRVELHTNEMAITLAQDGVKAITASDSLATQEQRESMKQLRMAGEEDQAVAMMQIDKMSDVATTVGSQSAPDWASSITDLRSRASGMSGLSAGSRSSRGSGFASSITGRKRGPASIASNSSAGSKRMRSAAYSVAGVTTASLKPLLPHYPWWMVRDAIAIWKNPNLGDMKVKIVEASQNHDRVKVELLEKGEGNREVQIKSLEKAEAETGGRIAALERPDREPITSIVGVHSGPGTDGNICILHNDSVEMRPEWSIVPLADEV